MWAPGSLCGDEDVAPRWPFPHAPHSTPSCFTPVEAPSPVSHPSLHQPSPVVPAPHTVVQPLAVMVEACDTLVAGAAVLGFLIPGGIEGG